MRREVRFERFAFVQAKDASVPVRVRKKKAWNPRGVPRLPNDLIQLEAKPGLKLTNPAREGCRRKTEPRVVNAGTAAKCIERSKIQGVEKIKEIKPEIDCRLFAEES
jgi:hypothetical protein